jgi:hypothetical protein
MRIHHIILKDKFLQPAKAFFDSPEFESTWHEVNKAHFSLDGAKRYSRALNDSLSTLAQAVKKKEIELLN